MRILVAMGLVVVGGLACGAEPLPQGGVPANWEDAAQVSLEVRFLTGPEREQFVILLTPRIAVEAQEKQQPAAE